MYREPGKVDKYVIDERPIISRPIVLKVPEMDIPAWLPGVTIFVLSPVLSGIAYTYLSGGIAFGTIMSLILFGLVGIIHAGLKT